MSVEKLKIDARRGKIIDILNRSGQVRISQLSKQLNATPVTIRSDLNALERDGYLERVQGGAVQTALNCFNREFVQKKHVHAEAKKRIAKAAAALIHDGDTVFINSGTTTYFTAVELKEKRGLRIVTNSLAVAIELGSIPTFSVILLGGEINSHDSFTYGNDVVEQLKRYRAHYAILSIDGVCDSGRVTTLHAEEALVDRTMIERADETIVVADGAKLGREGFSHVCDLSEGNRLVTEKGADPAFIKKMRAKNIRTVCG